MAEKTASPSMVVRFRGWKLLYESCKGLEHGSVEPIPMGVRDTDEGTDGIEGSDVERQQSSCWSDRHMPVRRSDLDKGIAAME
jgi:hypothetical protein